MDEMDRAYETNMMDETDMTDDTYNTYKNCI